MSLYVTEPPRGVIPHREVAHRFNLDEGTLVLPLPPSARRIGALGLTLLQTMGKSLRVTGGNAVRNQEHVLYSPIWATAHGLATVAVLDGQRVTAAMAAHLRELLGPAVRIIAVCEPGTAAKTKRLLARDGAQPQHLEWDEFTATHPQQAPAVTGVPAEADGYTFNDLPTTDFLVFRSTAAQLNDQTVFDLIDTHYRAAYTAATTITPEVDAVVAHLDQVTWQAQSTAPILVAIRATQAALFTRGWLLRARTDQLLGTLCSARHPKPLAADWRALRAYIRPERPATAALYLLGVPAGDLPSITMAAIQDALTDGTLARHPIPDLARPLLTAQLLRRQHEGFTADDAYLTLPPGNPRKHNEMLIDARRDLGLPIDGRNLRETNDSHSTRTLHRLGLELRSLT